MRQKHTTLDLIKLKNERKIASVTAYDFTSAQMAEEAELDFILVGDSLGMVVQGHDNTLKVTMDQMIYHAGLVRRGAPHTFVVGDMPWMSYHISHDDTLRNAARFFTEASVDAVKLEGGVKRAESIRALVNADMPVMGHVGLTPQSVNTLGGFKVQRNRERLLEDAQAVEEAGAFALVLEAVPEDLAREVTEMVKIPTIGIGAGSTPDGQILVWHDMLGLQGGYLPKFVKVYAQQRSETVKALKQYVDEVVGLEFPGPEHTYGKPRENNSQA